MESIKKLSTDDLEKVVGGEGGCPHPMPFVEGLEMYCIRPHDSLSKIASAYHTTVSFLLSINRDTISNKDDITVGYYIYVPKR